MYQMDMATKFGLSKWRCRKENRTVRTQWKQSEEGGWENYTLITSGGRCGSTRPPGMGRKLFERTNSKWEKETVHCGDTCASVQRVRDDNNWDGYIQIGHFVVFWIIKLWLSLYILCAINLQKFWHSGSFIYFADEFISTLFFWWRQFDRWKSSRWDYFHLMWLFSVDKTENKSLIMPLFRYFSV